MLEWLSLISTGVTFGSGATGAHGVLSGYRLAKSVDQINQRIELLDGNLLSLGKELRRMDERLYSTMTQTVWVEGKTKLIEPNRQLLLENGVNDGQSTFISDLYVEAPDGFRQSFFERPADFLIGVQRLRSGVPEMGLLSDPTLVPWHFKENGQDMVGFIKKGYLQSYLGLSFVPTIVSKRVEYLFENPYTGAHLSRMAPCYCGSKKRYKHCCGMIM